MSTAQTAPVSIPPPSGDVLAEMNGEIPFQSLSEVAVKVEEQMDESQLDRLATGVTVDTAVPSSSSSVRRAYQYLSHMKSLTFHSIQV